MAMETLLSHVPVPPVNLHRMRGEDPDVAAAARIMNLRFVGFFGSDIPLFDLVLLGIGPDGHTLSLFPGSAALGEREKTCRRHFVQKFNTWRITMTPKLVNNARHVLFQVEGADKAAPLQEILHGEYQPQVYPAQLIQPVDGDVDWLIVP